MTPDKALEILEGKVPHKEVSKRIFDEKKVFPSKKKAQETFTLNPALTINKNHAVTLSVLIILLAGVFIAIHLWRVAYVAESSYRHGVNDGTASMRADLELAQKEIDTKAQLINQLQQDMDKSNDNVILLQQSMAGVRKELESTSEQKDHLSQRLRNTQEYIPRKIRAIEDSFREKVKRLTARSQGAESRINDLQKQLRSLEKEAAQTRQERDKAQDVSRSVAQQNERLAQSLKETQESIPARIIAVEKPLQKQIDDLNHQLNLKTQECSS